jgi:hypothetical protein
VSQSLDMVALVARGLGDLRKDVAFLGGAVTTLLITDPAAPEVRPTDDVDVIIEIVSHAAYARLREHLRNSASRRTYLRERRPAAGSSAA